MADRINQKLDWRAWLAALEDMCVAAVCACAREEASILRAFNHLLGRAPPMALGRSVVALAPARLEALIDMDMCSGAFLAMIERGTCFIVSRGDHSEFLVSVALPGQASEDTADGPTLTLAGIRALTAALVGNMAGHQTHGPTLRPIRLQ